MPTTRAARSPAPAKSSVLARVLADHWGVLGHSIPYSSTLAAALRRLVRGG